MKFTAFEQDWEINDISRKQRRELHHLNEKVYGKSKFEIIPAKNGEDPEINIKELIIDNEAQNKLYENALDLAFDNAEELDELLTDTEQDTLAVLIVKRYLTIEKKKSMK